MMLTPLNIQVAIIKAFYALAKKSVKYYTGLAFGKNNTCLFKEIRLLRVYLEILKNFEIVGSTITCCCSVEGDYTVLLNTDLPLTNANIQFGCDNQGYMLFNNIGYPFTYWYDVPNNKIVIQFVPDVPNPNRVSNPNMTFNLNGWNVDNFEYSGYGVGSALYIGEGADGYLMQNVLEIGKTYTVTFDLLTDFDAIPNNTTITVYAGTQEVEIFNDQIANSEVITLETTITCFGNTEFKIVGKSDLDFANLNFFIKNVDVREVVNTTITVEDVEFSSECNILGNAASPIEVAVIESITNPPVTVDNIYGTWDGSITISKNGNVAYSLIIPVGIIDNPIAIVDYWAANALSDWILLYDEGHFVIYSPFNNVDYSAYTAYFNQYEGGRDATLGFDLSELPPFVNVNTPATANILFKQNTFILSRRPETQSVPVPTTLPYVATPTPAVVDILIPRNQFAVGTPATMSIPLNELFNTTSQEFYYEGTLMFSHMGSYTDMAELVNNFNSNNGLGFSASDGGTLPIPGEVLATASNAANVFNTGIFDDVYTARLFNQNLGINLTIGTYTVGDDSPEDIANFLSDSITDSNIYQGTVSVVGTVITLTAPVGTGDSWNTGYAFELQKNNNRSSSYVFSGGQAPPTIPIHLLDITAPNIYPQTAYDGTLIEIQYPGYEPDGSQFAGAVDTMAGVVTFDDSLTMNTIYTSSTVFSNISEMLNDFNYVTGNSLDAIAEITNFDPVNYTVTITVPSPPNAAYDFNGNTLTYMYTYFSIYTNIGTYSGGIDTTISTYTLTVYTPGAIAYTVVTNSNNYTDIQSILDEINANSLFNVDFTIFTGESNDIYMSTVLASSAFNNFYFELNLTYSSAEYTASNFTTDVVLGTMTGGVDRVAPNISLVNDFNATTIYSLAQDSYNFNGINGFITAFNTASPYNYTAEFIGSYGSTPELMSTNSLNLPTLTYMANRVTRLITYYTTIPSISAPRISMGVYVAEAPADYAPANVASGLAASINALGFPGTAYVTFSTNLIVEAPSGTFGSWNGRYIFVERTYYIKASVLVTFLTGSDGEVTGQLQLGVSGPNPISLGTLVINGTHDAAYWALAYVNFINANTITHGYTATVESGNAGRVIKIIAPTFSGSAQN